MKSNGRRLHEQAAKAREEGQFFESLDLNDQALFDYDKADDSVGFTEGIACRSITLRVYANQHNSNRLLMLAKYEMMGSVAIAKESGDKTALALPLYNLAELQEDLGELEEAVASYKDAVSAMEQNPPTTHNRPEVLANMRVHLYTCAYKAGDKTALEKAQRAQNELESAENSNHYEQNVWVSGGYMRLADALRKYDSPKAKRYLLKAKEIIDTNPKLELRKQQWEKLCSRFN